MADPCALPAACALDLACLIGLHFVCSKEELKAQVTAPIAVRGTPRPASGTGAGADLRPALERAQEQLATDHQQLSAAEETETQSLRTRSAAGRMRDQQTAQTPALQAKVRETECGSR